MAEPITAELPQQPRRLTIGETPVYLASPLEADGQTITELTVRGAANRGKDGLQSAVLLLKESSRRRGEEGQAFSKPLTNINDLEEIDWDKVGGIQWTASDGTVHTITKEQLSLTKPEPEDLKRSHPASQGETFQEPALARKVLETYSGTPTMLTIVGLKAYETRAHTLADRAMQMKTRLGERIWKQGFGPAYFHEKLRQHYLDMLKASASPFAAESIRIAEAAGANRYQELLKNKNFVTRGSRRFIEWAKSNLGMRTLVQKFALEEIAAMREKGEVRERDSFDREAAAIRKRFETDVENQDSFIRKSLGEDLVLLDRPEHGELVAHIKGLVKRYASGDIATKADFDKETDALFQTRLKTAQPRLFEQAELYASSLYEVAEALRARAGHEGGLSAIDAQLEAMQVRIGMGVMGEATALEPTDVQKGTQMVRSFLTKLEKKGVIGPFLFNEATVASGVAAALSLAVLPKMGISGLARGVGGFAGGAAAGALFGGWREYRALEREYLTHIREREAGLTFPPDAKRRAWMERFFVSQRRADELIGILTKEPASDEEARLKLATLADGRARRALSAREHERKGPRVGLIGFSSRENIETERTALDLAIANAEGDLLASGTATKEFIDTLAAVQERVLTDGMDALEGLDDPVRVTLGLLEKYNPEVDVMRRRFPLLGPEAAVGKARGLEEIFKEFRRAARGAAVKKGLVVGATGALIGLGIREGLQLGMEVGDLAAPGAPEGFSPPESVMGTDDFMFSNTMHVDGGNLVDTQGHVVVDGFKNILSDTANFQNGQLTDAGKQAILNAARQNGFELEIPPAVKTVFAFSGNTHPMPDLAPGHPPIAAPEELHWQFARGEGWQLVLDAKNANNDPIPQVLYTMAERPGAEVVPEQVFTDHPFLSFTPEQTLSHDVPPDVPHVLGLPGVRDALGSEHFIKSTIPQGTDLLEERVTGTGEHIYRLVDVNTKEILLDNIHIETDGHIANIEQLRAAAAVNGINLDHTLEETVTRVERSDLSDTFLKTVSDMGESHGARGEWGWFEEPIRNDPSISHALPATNLAKNLFRGTYENYYHAKDHVTGTFAWDFNGYDIGEKVNYNLMQPDTVFHDIPKALFLDEQLVKLGHLMDNAIDLRETQGVNLLAAFSDLSPEDVAKLSNMGIDEHEYEILKSTYEIGRVGRVATADEIAMFIEHLGGGTKEITVELYRPVIDRVIAEAIPAKIEGVNGAVVTNVITLPEAPAVPELRYVAIPLIWRWPLETPLLHAVPGLIPPEFTPPTYFTYGGEQVFLTGDEYTNRRSPRLNEDSEKKLNQQEEISWHLSTLTEEDRRALDELIAQHTNPVPDAVRAVIAIPANKEGRNIYTTLSQYAKQKDLRGTMLDPASYEIVIYDNRVAEVAPDTTKEEVLRFKQDHPEMNIVYLEHVLSEKPTIGRVRRNLTNSILMRLEGRNPALPDVAIVSNDADSIDLPDKYLATIMASFDTNKRLDAITGRYDFPEEVYKKYPVLFATERAWQLMDAIVRHNEQSGIPQLTGANSAVRAGTLAAIGGYNPKSPLGEDLEVGWMIQSARKSDPTRFLFSNALKVYTDPRRAIYKYLQGAGFLDRYTDFADNTEIRGLSWQELATRAQEAYSREKLEENLTRLRGELYPWLRSSNTEALDRYFKRAMEFLGVAYELRDNKVVITDDSVLRAGINAEITPEEVVRQIASQTQTVQPPAPQPAPTPPATAP